jgi:hypothetical protein
MFIAYLVGYILNGAFKSASPRQCVANIVCCILWPAMAALALLTIAIGHVVWWIAEIRQSKR